MRSTAIESLNEQFKAIFDGQGPVPTKRLRAAQRFSLGAIFVYQLPLGQRAEAGLDVRVGLNGLAEAV